ncbi:MAG: endonuclease domain-containing protein [Clostridia bacterium]|nr:endonuclease domain-containing protein [Clostridia bacterium]
MQRKYNKRLIPLARTLRKNMTREEKHLWYDFLRNHPARFTRQKVLGKYIADFYSSRAKLVIELDGTQHFEPDALEYDKQRTEFIEEYGVTVYRVWNWELNTNFSGVCQGIQEFVEDIIPEIVNEYDNTQ